MSKHVFEQSNAIKVMDIANKIGALVIIVTGIVLCFYNVTDDSGYYEETTYPLVGFGIGTLVFGILGYFYGQLFINAAFDIQVSRQTNELILYHLERGNFSNTVTGVMDTKSVQDDVIKEEEPIGFLAELHKIILYNNSNDVLEVVLQDPRINEYPHIIEKINNLMNSDFILRSSEWRELLLIIKETEKSESE